MGFQGVAVLQQLLLLVAVGVHSYPLSSSSSSPSSAGLFYCGASIPPRAPTATKRTSKGWISHTHTNNSPLVVARGGGKISNNNNAVTTALASTTDPLEEETESLPAVPSIWNDVPQGPPDAILGIAQSFAQCTDPRKVNICVGAYRDADGRPWVLPTVQTAETRLLQQQQQQQPASSGGSSPNNPVNKEYLPIEGDLIFVKKAIQFAYGANVDMDRIAAVQTLSGTGACRVGGAFLGGFCKNQQDNTDTDDESHSAAATTTILIPVPTWGNHWKIFGAVPGLTPTPYRYYNAATNRLDFDGLLQDLSAAPDGSIVVLHACAHNPTGCDPTPDQWREIALVLERKRHIGFFDSAYQGFASGDAEKDAWALRYVVAKGTIPVLLAQSFAKNFGLYGERCGTLSVVCANAEEKSRVVSQLQGIIRPMYSSPPKHGSSIVKTILQDEALTAQYYTECRSMADRIAEMRLRLVEELGLAGSTHDWSHVLEQIGMFAFTGMNSGMCDELTSQYAIFLTRDGRISLAGLNEKNLPYVAQAVHAVTDGKAISTMPTTTN